MIQQILGSTIANNPQHLEEVLALDRLNMESIMKASNYGNFPWEKRIAGLRGDSTQFFGAYEDEKLIGYFELCRDWKDAKDIYLASIQIHPTHQGSLLFKALIRTAYNWLKGESFNFLRSEVQIANIRMLKIFKRFDFEILDGPRPHTKLVRGTFNHITHSKAFKKIMSENRSL